MTKELSRQFILLKDMSKDLQHSLGNSLIALNKSNRIINDIKDDE